MPVFDASGRAEYDRYPLSVRAVITVACIAVATVLLVQPDKFPVGTSLIPIAAAGIAWLLEWRFTINLRTNQIRVRRGLRDISKENALQFDDLKSIRIDFHPAQGNNGETFSLAAVFKFNGLTDMKLKKFTDLGEAVDEADEIHRETGIPITESDALSLRRAAFDHVGDLIDDSKKKLPKR